MHGLKTGRKGSRKIRKHTARQGITVAETGVVSMQMERLGQSGVYDWVSLVW